MGKGKGDGKSVLAVTLTFTETGIVTFAITVAKLICVCFLM